ncbi:MAG: hypothetical protein ACOCRK_00645 [bacterium]
MEAFTLEDTNKCENCDCTEFSYQDDKYICDNCGYVSKNYTRTTHDNAGMKTYDSYASMGDGLGESTRNIIIRSSNLALNKKSMWNIDKKSHKKSVINSILKKYKDIFKGRIQPEIIVYAISIYNEIYNINFFRGKNRNAVIGVCIKMSCDTFNIHITPEQIQKYINISKPVYNVAVKNVNGLTRKMGSKHKKLMNYFKKAHYTDLYALFESICSVGKIYIPNEHRMPIKKDLQEFQNLDPIDKEITTQQMMIKIMYKYKLRVKDSKICDLFSISPTTLNSYKKNPYIYK